MTRRTTSFLIALLVGGPLLVGAIVFGNLGVHEPEIRTDTRAPSIADPDYRTSQRESRGCEIRGCSGELCVDEDAPESMTICLYKDSYRCFEAATCGRNADDVCAWQPEDDVQACLDEYEEKDL